MSDYAFGHLDDDGDDDEFMTMIICRVAYRRVATGICLSERRAAVV